MFFSLKANYCMQNDSYGCQGGKFTVSKSSNVLTLPLYVMIAATAVWKGFLSCETWNTQTYAAVVAIIVSSVLFLQSLRRIHTESLLIISTVGVTVQRSNLLGTSSHFFDISTIEDIVIVEAFSMQSVIFQLVLLPKERKSKDGDEDLCKNTKTFPLFLDFRPKLLDLQTIYREVQNKLYPVLSQHT